MATIDPMQQALLGQIARPRQDGRRSLAASLMRLSPPPAPINNAGAGLAYALTQGLNGFVGGRMMRDAEESDMAREAQAFERYSNFVNQQRQAQAAEFAAVRNPQPGGAMPEQQSFAPALPPDLRPGTIGQQPLPPLPAAAQRGEAPPAVSQGIAARRGLDPNAPDYPQQIMAINNGVVGATMPGQRPQPVQQPGAMPVAQPQRVPELDALNLEIERVGQLAARGNPMAQTYLQELRDRRGVMLQQQGRADQQGFQAQQAAQAQAERAAQAEQQRAFLAEQARLAREGQVSQAELTARLAREGRAEERTRLSPAEITLREETEDRLAGAVSARRALDAALALSPQAYAGPLAETRGRIAGVSGLDPETAAATTQFGSIMTEQALSQLRAIFGGNPTEGERKILIDMQASPNMSRIEREALIRRAQEAVATREAAARTRLREVMSGNYARIQGAPAPGQPAGQGAQPGNQPVRVTTPEEAAALPPGTEYITPDGARYRR